MAVSSRWELPNSGVYRSRLAIGTMGVATEAHLVTETRRVSKLFGNFGGMVIVYCHCQLGTKKDKSPSFDSDVCCPVNNQTRSVARPWEASPLNEAFRDGVPGALCPLAYADST
jgi:hypothetical protein